MPAAPLYFAGNSCDEKVCIHSSCRLLDVLITEHNNYKRLRRMLIPNYPPPPISIQVGTIGKPLNLRNRSPALEMALAISEEAGKCLKKCDRAYSKHRATRRADHRI